jgi:hypothetical protein
MEATMGQLRMLAKDQSSGEQGCPSVYEDNGEFVVQGPEHGLAGLANVLPGETAVRISPDVVRAALARLDAGL